MEYELDFELPYSGDVEEWMTTDEDTLDEIDQDESGTFYDDQDGVYYENDGFFDGDSFFDD